MLESGLNQIILIVYGVGVFFALCLRISRKKCENRFRFLGVEYTGRWWFDLFLSLFSWAYVIPHMIRDVVEENDAEGARRKYHSCPQCGNAEIHVRADRRYSPMGTVRTYDALVGPMGPKRKCDKCGWSSNE